MHRSDLMINEAANTCQFAQKSFQGVNLLRARQTRLIIVNLNTVSEHRDQNMRDKKIIERDAFVAFYIAYLKFTLSFSKN